MTDSEPGEPDPPTPYPPSRARSWLLPAVLVAMALAWAFVATGLVSSNDGSHVALARALGLRQETTIDPEVGLTLWVDRAARDGHEYSDRPPGTAMVAMPAVWLGAQLDPVLARYTERTRSIAVAPASRRFIATYGARIVRLHAKAPALARLQGTAAVVAVHTAALGLLGGWAVLGLLRRRSIGLAGCVFALTSLGGATLWGPYSTVLFSHVTTGAALIAGMWLLEFANETVVIESPRRRVALWLAAGATFGLAIASDYAVALVVAGLIAWVPARGCGQRWQRAAWSGVGVALALLPTLAYHDAAFGSPWSIGYDFHTNFAFARTRSATFGGDPLGGVWVLLGRGRGAGMLAQSPIALVGFAGLLWTQATRPVVLAFAPWIALLAFHQTPWGGATEDHRYLVPFLPVCGVGLGVAWDQLGRSRRWVRYAARLTLVGVAVVSALGVWSHFFGWRDG